MGNLEKSEKSHGLVLSNEVAGSSANFKLNSCKFYKVYLRASVMRDTSVRLVWFASIARSSFI